MAAAIVRQTEKGTGTYFATVLIDGVFDYVSELIALDG
jgi:hypothetical protein